ncbi:MAG: hypothetical protein AAFO94_13050, partial [Bacteroidota bacterium]
MKKTPEVLERLIRRKKWQRAGRLVLRWTIRGIALLALLFFALVLIVQTTWFQNWATQQAASYLSETLQTRVEVGRVDIDFFDNLVLESLYVEDYDQDTLIYANRLSANFNTSVIQLIRRDLNIESLTLEDAAFNLRRDSGQAVNNLALILNNMFPKDRKKDNEKVKKPFFLDVESIYLHQVKFEREDIPWGKYLLIDVEEGTVHLNALDIPDNLIDIREVHFINPLIQVEERLRDEEAMEQEWVALEAARANAPPEVVDSTASPFAIAIDKFRLDDGKFVLHNFRRSPVKTTPKEILDYQHLDVFDIQLDVDSFLYTEGVYTGDVQKIAFEDISGFVLNELSAESATVSNRRVELEGVQLNTPYSTIGDELVFKYRQFSDFLDFNNKVLMDITLENSRLALKDLMVFAPGLRDNQFFARNRDEILAVDGVFKGRINNLRANDLNLRLGKNTEMVGSFSSADLTEKNNAFLQFELDRFHSDIQTLKLLIPNFNPPSNFDKLGEIYFKGRFDGFFVDFVADGDLLTDLGRATMDMRLDLKGGRTGANYSGNLSLLDFDMGGWSGNPDLGTVSFVGEVKDGRGLTVESVNAKLKANIEHFQFKDYDYENVSVNGELNRNLFD